MLRPDWLENLNQYKNTDQKKSISQVFVSLTAYLILMTTMFYLFSKSYPYWMILLISVLAAGFLVRLFIIFHDCTHYSFFNPHIVCFLLGHFLGILVFTAFSDWQKAHAVHHYSVGNLEKRGVGDVWTMTVQEYLASSFWKRLMYRIYRNPIVLFIIGPLILFLIINRFPHKRTRKKEFWSIMFTNAMIALIIILSYFTIGIKTYLAVQLPVIYIAAILGVWLFYIQHQFEDVYWDHNGKWDLYYAAMYGSSFYKLPAILNWFAGNIGFHNLHHLNTRIPNYKLRKCYRDTPELKEIKPITFFKGFKSLFLHLWDEDSRKLVGYSFLKRK